MKRTALLLGLFVLFGGLAQAQNPVLNGGMENWSGDTPDNWRTTNIPGFSNVTQSSDAHSGSSSARGEVIDIGGGIPFAPSITTGDLANPYFPVTTTYQTLRFWYKLDPQGPGEGMAVGAQILDASLLPVGLVDTILTAAASGWTLVEVPFDNDLGNNNPPANLSIIIAVGSDQGLTIGTNFQIDDIELVDPISGIRRQLDGAVVTDFALEQNYPNPFNPETNIRFAVPKTAAVQLAVFNARGQEVARLVDGTMAAGTYVVDWNAADLASGVYFYTLRSAGQSLTRRMLLVK